MENSQDFDPQSCSEVSEQRCGRPKQQQKYVSGEKNGKWSDRQNTQYIVYIQFHKDKMRSKQKRRVSKLYKEMSRFIGSRNALQCRSHHQKLQDRYLYPNKIIANYKQNNDLALYHLIRQELEQYQANLTKQLTPYLKLQVSNMLNPTQPDLAATDQLSINSSQEPCFYQLPNENTFVSWMPDPSSFIPLGLNANWGAYLYYPIYQID